jgi:signal peptidase I
MSPGWWCILLFHLIYHVGPVEGFSAINRPYVKLIQRQQLQHTPDTYSFLIPLINERPRPDSLVGAFVELWNDPRPLSSLIANDDRTTTDMPYCIVSDEFEIGEESFQISLYPRGRVNSLGSNLASAYLRYLPGRYGDEVDVSWRLRLRSDADRGGNNSEMKSLSVSTSGGLPRSNTTWSAAMTFCTEMESVESVGRTTDWGSSIWSASEVCNALAAGTLYAKGEMTIYDRRSGESSFALPLFQKGAMGAVIRAAKGSGAGDFRAGEVIVPRKTKGSEDEIEALRRKCVYVGVDYRIMTITDKNGNPMFSTYSLLEKSQARLALRPCGWKLQQQLWKRDRMSMDWPVEVDAGLLLNVATTRFNPDSAVPRIVSAFQRDWIAYTLALALALTPIPLTLFGKSYSSMTNRNTIKIILMDHSNAARNFVSLYDIPSASMEPTLLKGDVLLVEKFPRIYQRTKRGDVVLFQPPPALRDIVSNSGSQLSSTSLFVKRLVGIPGDQEIRLIGDNDVVINGIPAVGPDRGLCADSQEPLRLIDKLIENGRGKDINQLGDDDVFVLGDCKAVSVDSRVFGALPKQNVVGKPIARVWPLNRIKLSGLF